MLAQLLIVFAQHLKGSVQLTIKWKSIYDVGATFNSVYATLVYNLRNPNKKELLT